MKGFNSTHRRSAAHDVHAHPPIPSFMPQTAAPTDWVGSVRKRVLGLRRRRQLRKLLVYSDRTLIDIGYSRGDILRTLHRHPHSVTPGSTNSIHLQNLHPEQPRIHH